MASSTIKMLANLSTLLTVHGNTSGEFTDLNNAPSNAVSWVNGDFSNTPDGSARFAGHIITIATIPTHQFQFAIRYTGADFYMRTYVNGTWNACSAFGCVGAWRIFAMGM